MIQQNTENENTQIELNSGFISAIKEMKISKLLYEANIRKGTRTLTSEINSEKRTAFEIFQFLLLMVFQGCNMYRYLGSKRQDIACSKSTYHRFLNDRHYNWKLFITRLAAKVISWLDKLTDPKRFKAFVLDDSFIGRKRSKKVELLSFIYDHVSGRSLPGFNPLTLGWTDGFSFIPVAFNMLASAVKSKRIVDIKEGIDKRTNGYKNRMDAIKQKPESAIAMIKTALNAGIEAGYVLMDTWFTNEPFIKQIKELGLEVIGMLKDNKQMYHYRGKLLNLKEIAAHHVRFNTRQDCLGSIVVSTRHNRIPVKLVFVRNRNKRDEYLIILSTDCTLSDEEIIRRYGYRWSIECCFKVSKSLLKLGKEFQPVNYDTTVSSTALVFTRFIILEWIRRKENDVRTLGELFYATFDEVRDIEMADALNSLLSILASGLKDGDIQIGERTRKELLQWYISQPQFIRSICEQSMMEASLLYEEDEMSRSA